MKSFAKLFAVRIRNRTRLIKIGYYKSLRTESQKIANEILVSTFDLLSILPNAKYLPNPVDVEIIFRKMMLAVIT